MGKTFTLCKNYQKMPYELMEEINKNYKLNSLQGQFYKFYQERFNSGVLCTRRIFIVTLPEQAFHGWLCVYLILF